MPTRWHSTGRRAVERLLAGPALLPLPIAFVFATRSWLAPGWSDNHMLWGDWSAHACNLFAFLFGALLRGSPALRAAVGRQWKLAGMLAIGAWLVIAACELAYPGDTKLPAALSPAFCLARAVEMWEQSSG